jgi:hypothetical protein
MKANHFLLLSLFAIVALFTQGCLKDSCEREVSYVRVEPVFKTIEEIHQGTAVQESPRELKNPGQIYFYNNIIFIVEKREGIHVIDNTNPGAPQNVKFIAIPGTEDLAIRNGILYANSFIDLLAIDLNTFQVAGRLNNVFPPLWEDLANNKIAVYYQETQVTEVLDCESYNKIREFNGVLIDCAYCDIAVLESSVSPNAGIGAPGTGIGGSMARFTIIGDYLYAIDQVSMDVFDLSQPASPALANTVNIGWGIETIFPYGDKLFIGSNSGMFIFDNTNPTAPVMLSAFEHARACDPVFVKDNYAYVTLRDGTVCQGFVNQLDLVDITNLTAPKLVKSFPMDNPHGLSIKDSNLFLCEGKFGLKAFDITEPKTLDQNLLDHEKGLHAFDVISLPGQQNVVLVIGEDGFYQYSFDTSGGYKLLSKIQVNK